MGMMLVPSVSVDTTVSASTVADLIKQCGDDLPNPSALETEIHLWNVNGIRHPIHCLILLQQHWILVVVACFLTYIKSFVSYVLSQ